MVAVVGIEVVMATTGSGVVVGHFTGCIAAPISVAAVAVACLAVAASMTGLG